LGHDNVHGSGGSIHGRLKIDLLYGSANIRDGD
jgi:hypothetical protein